ncbi:hypothetical protein [Mycobacterium sp. NPDC050041]|uniref:hypothetical protein n=1 Tax=Mycobacterium sp. NPDC050041 TaxID=3364293 RepID=UPI003C2EBE8E
MAEVKKKPQELKSTNALDDVHDPDQPQPAEKATLKLSGAAVATVDNPPAMGGRIILMTELEVIDVGVRSTDGGQTLTPYRICRRVGDMWRHGEERPPVQKTKTEIAAEKAKAEADAKAEAEKNQPPLYEDAPAADAGRPDFSDGEA